ncbi:MAG: DNA alkylation repair protein, partial [Elusimicrobiota bacterium]|nr:DNA alkylation repair protein [Elusimicrobiota bacterium]
IDKYREGGENQKKEIVSLYCRNTAFINNWYLVDLSAPNIAGDFWFKNGTKTMFEFSKSGQLWKERISIVSNLYFIRRGHFQEILKLCSYFLGHKHDLIHKASGWMLRETGKKDIAVLRGFLDKYCKEMPRTMLRYSIEKLSEKERRKYMNS